MSTTLQSDVQRTVSLIEHTDEFVGSTFSLATTAVRVLRVTYEVGTDGARREVSRRMLNRNIAAIMADPDAAAMLTIMPPIFDRWAAEDDAAALAALTPPPIDG